MRSRNALLHGLLAAGLLTIFGNCKDVVGPAPVDSVSLAAADLDLVPAETTHLSATVLDAVGGVLTRPVSWQSSQPSVATVTNGLVTGMSVGTTTITASAEGKSASVQVVVEDGGLIPPAGATISAVGGMVQLSVPPSAVISTSRLLVRQTGKYPASPRLVKNTAIEVASNGPSKFAYPATLSIRYNDADLGGKPDSFLRIYEVQGSQWVEVPQSAVSAANKTVSAPVTDLGTYAILFLPSVASVGIDPSSTVLTVGSSRKFTASVRDETGNPLTGRPIAWSTNNSSVATVDAATGDVTAVAPGSATISATADGVSGNSSVQVTVGSAAQIRLNDGDGQTADAGTAVSVPPSVVVTDAKGFAVAGAVVTFVVTAGGGSITGASAVSDANGIARVGSWTLGAAGGANTMSATADGLSGSPIVFSATGRKKVVIAAVPAKISIFAGDGQTALPGATVPIAPAVKVVDDIGNPVAGVTVTFSIRSGAGTLTGAAAVSEADGIATVGSWKLGDAGGNSLFATLAGVAGSPLIFVATAASASPSPSPAPPPSPSAPPAAIAIYAGDGQTAVSGTAVPVRPAVKVTDADGRPVSGVIVSFSIRSGAGSLTQPDAVSDVNGIATVGSWILGTPGGNSLFASVTGVAGSPLIFVAVATLPAGSGVRIITFGDSNTDIGWAGTNPNPIAAAYVSSVSEVRLSPNSPNSRYQLAGKIEARWAGISAKPITAVNHAISATSTGVGRTPRGAPNAREQVNGVTRYEGEVVGAGYPWSGGEPGNPYYAAGPILRTKSFTPGANDFVYVSMGSNDPGASISAATTAANLEWMIDVWVNSGHAADHFILTTLAPAIGAGNLIAQINTQIRSLASRRGVRLIDLSVRTSDDNSVTWRSSADNIGDGIHYSEAVRDWLADQVVSILYQTVPK